MNEQPDSHRVAGDIDRMIDAAVARVMSASPRPGFGRRVAARLERDWPARRRPFAPARWAFAGGGALVIIALGTFGHVWHDTARHTRGVQSMAATTRQQQARSTRSGAAPLPEAGPAAGRVEGGPLAMSRGLDAASGFSAVRTEHRAATGPGRHRIERARENAVVEGPPPLEIARVAPPASVAIESIEVGLIALDDLLIAPLQVDDDTGTVRRR
jgi:hypothetical protein